MKRDAKITVAAGRINKTRRPLYSSFGNSGYPATTLPFYNEIGDKHIGHYWALPATGFYGGSRQAGQAMARAYLKHLAETKDAGRLLHYVAYSMTDRLKEAGSEAEADCIRGQMHGFFMELCKFIREAVAVPKLAKSYLRESKEEIVAEALDGLAFNPKPRRSK